MAKKNKKDKKEKDLKKKKKNKKKLKQQKTLNIERPEVLETFNRLVNLISDLETEPIVYNNETYHYAEIKALDAIKNLQPISTADLATNLDISRNAVLKTTNKLLDKGLIKKEKSKVNKRVLLITLTDKGEEFANHAKGYPREVQEPIMEALGKMNDKELAYFNDGLERILMNLTN